MKPAIAPPVPDVSPLHRRGLVLAAVAGLAAVTVLRVKAVPRQPDGVLPAEAAARAAAMRALPPLKLDPVSLGEVDAAWRSLALPAADLAKLQADVLAGRVRLAWLSLFDSDAEDGDRVTVASMGVLHTMPLARRPVPVALPLPVSGRISIAAVDEGLGGGVTVGIVAAGQVHRLPPMQVGQSFSLVVEVP